VNIPAIAKSAVATAFRVADSILKDCVYHRFVAGTYDPALGANSADSTSTTSIRPIFGVYNQRLIDNQRIRSGDKRIIIKGDELSVNPKPDDYIIDAAGVRWDVIEVDFDVTQCVWIVQGRANQP